MKMTIGKKLGLGFGIVLLIFAISGLVSVVLLKDIGKRLDEVINVQEPITEAAYEMEINLIGTGFGLLGYLEDRDPKHLDRIKGDMEDFATYQKQYNNLEQADKVEGVGLKLRRCKEILSAKLAFCRFMKYGHMMLSGANRATLSSPNKSPCCTGKFLTDP